MTHEYPHNPTFDSVGASRVMSLGDVVGFTQRQREFLVTVMVHSGCFLERQYCTELPIGNFRERKGERGHLGDPSDRYIATEFRQQGMARITALYRAWRRKGDAVLWRSSSTSLRDDRTHGCSACEIQMLNGQYLQLTRPAAANGRLHAATQGIRSADLEGAESGRARGTRDR